MKNQNLPYIKLSLTFCIMLATVSPFSSYAQQGATFNTTDVSILTNGNFRIAANKIMRTTPSQIWALSQEVSAAQVTKKPYSSLGKLYKLTGSVYKVVEMPSTPVHPGKWGEILLMVDNPNSAVGGETVAFEYHGDIENINPNTTITCAGYFIGTYESQNAVGGTVECITL
jgi:hypothetical protein